MPKAKLPPGPLKVFSANNTTAILDANDNEVVSWMGFDRSERTRAEHELLASELVRRFNANVDSEAVLAEVVKWALDGHISEVGVSVAACKAIRAVAAGVVGRSSDTFPPSPTDAPMTPEKT